MRRLLVVALLAAVGAGAWLIARRPSDGGPGTARTAAPAHGAASAPGLPGWSAASGDDEVDRPGALRLEGQVIDAEERPVGGATVELSFLPPRRVTTEADGSFVFDHLLARPVTVWAVKGDGFAGPVTVRLGARTEPVILRLAPSGTLEVTVISVPDRRPVAGATLSVRTATATSGADGKATLRPLGPGRAVLEASAPGFAPARAPVLGGHGTHSLTVELRRGAAVSGTVVDDSGQPVAGARVRAAPPGPPRWPAPTVATDGGGRWSFEALAAGSFRFGASDERHAPGLSEPVTLDGKTARSGIAIRLEAGASVAGQVVRPDGTPVAAASIRVGARGEEPRQAFCDEHGNFALGGLPRKAVELVAAGESASSDIVPLDLAAAPSQNGVTVLLDLDGQIAGTVVDGKGQPVAGAQVTAVPGRPGGAGGRGGGALRLRGPAQDLTDSGGRFTLRGLPEGSYRLRATRGATPGFGMPGGRGGTQARTGDTDVQLALEEQGRVVGKVLFSDGSAPSGFTVATGLGPGASFRGGDGAFEVDAAAGPVTLTVSGPLFKGTSVVAQVQTDQETDVGTISVERGRSITGTVRGSDGTPAAGATVYAGATLAFGPNFGPVGPGVQQAESGDDGSYVIGGVPAKPLLIAADLAGVGRSTIQHVPGGADSAQIDLALLGPGALVGRVTSGGQPVAGASVTATPQQAALSVQMVRAGADGSYRFDTLAPDTYTVSARPQGPQRGANQSETVTIAAQQEAHLDVDIPVGTVTVTAGITGAGVAMVALVSGTVTAARGDELMAAVVARGPGSAHEDLARAGRPARLTEVVPGAYTACAIGVPPTVTSLRDALALRDKLDELPCACVPITIGDAPTQSITVPAPPPG
jgi:protocatechuate 3,4-dioxygenase beta subunit